VANRTLRSDDPFRPDTHLLDVRLVIPLPDIVLTAGNEPSLYQVFIKCQSQDVGTSGQLGWKADHLYAALIFYLLWQGPTPWDNFWPNWPVDIGPPSHDTFIAAQAEREESKQQRQATVREQVLLAVKTLRLYEANTSNRHPHIFCSSNFSIIFRQSVSSGTMRSNMSTRRQSARSLRPPTTFARSRAPRNSLLEQKTLPVACCTVAFCAKL
jgi:hypothetical protein